jgi:hypothetical protein
MQIVDTDGYFKNWVNLVILAAVLALLMLVWASPAGTEGVDAEDDTALISTESSVDFTGSWHQTNADASSGEYVVARVYDGTIELFTVDIETAVYTKTWEGTCEPTASGSFFSMGLGDSHGSRYFMWFEGLLRYNDETGTEVHLSLDPSYNE